MQSKPILKRGAEATISLGEFLGRRVVLKKRDRKQYRDRRLDARVIKTRTRNEVRSMVAARSSGIHVPRIYDVDIADGLIVMQLIDGERLNTLLYRLNDGERRAMERRLGSEIARLHMAGISHGDMTTSNIIAFGDDLYFIDFSMAARPSGPEQLGVDMRLLKEVFRSSHSEFESEFAVVVEGYRQAGGDRTVIDKVSEMERRARYV